MSFSIIFKSLDLSLQICITLFLMTSYESKQYEECALSLMQTKEYSGNTQSHRVDTVVEIREKSGKVKKS